MDIGDGSLPPFRELTEVATRLKGKLRNPQDLYGDVDSALKLVGMLESGNRGKEPKGEAVAIPKPLQQLGEISDFRVMVTLTPDDMLARALRSAKRAVHEVVHSPKLPTSEVKDLQVDWQRPAARAAPLYVRQVETDAAVRDSRRGSPRVRAQHHRRRQPCAKEVHRGPAGMQPAAHRLQFSRLAEPFYSSRHPQGPPRR